MLTEISAGADGVKLSAVTPETVTPSRERYSRYDVVESLRRFAAQHNLTIQFTYEEGRYFKAELPTTALVAEHPLVSKPAFSLPDPRDKPLGQSRDCLVSDLYEMRQSAYYLACQISERTLLLCVPNMTIQVPDLLTYDIELKRAKVSAGHSQWLPEAVLQPLLGEANSWIMRRPESIGRTRTENEAKQDAIAALLPALATINKAFIAQGYCLSIDAITPTPPSKSRNSPDDVVQALRRFAAQNKLTIDVSYVDMEQCFHADLLTSTNMFDTVLLRSMYGFVGSVFGQSPACLSTDKAAMPRAEYDLACQISERQLLLDSGYPCIELQVPDLLTCAIDKREIAA